MISVLGQRDCMLCVKIIKREGGCGLDFIGDESTI